MHLARIYLALIITFQQYTHFPNDPHTIDNNNVLDLLSDQEEVEDGLFQIINLFNKCETWVD